jgi:tetratricopeptide (TPR) repeat protein
MTYLLIAAGAIILVLVVAVLSAQGQSDSARIRKMIEEGRRDEAKTILKSRISRDDRNPAWHFLLGRIYEEEYNFEHAVVEFRIVIKMASFTAAVQRDEVIARIVENYLRLGQIDDALRNLDEENRKKESRVILGLMARLLNLKNESAAALSLINRLIALRPNDPAALAEQGDILRKQGKLTEAVSVLDTATRTDRRNFHAWFYLGQAYKDKKEFEKAVQAFENAKFDRDLRPRALFDMAGCFRSRDMNKNAIEQYERLVTEWDDSPYYRKTNPATMIAEARYQLAEAYLLDRDYQSAIDQWEILQSFQANYKDVASKLQANRRFGKDRVQDFLIASSGEFEKVSIHAVELMGFRILQRRLANSDRMTFVVQETGKGRPRKHQLWVLRVHAPVGETILAEFEKSMKDQGLTSGIVVSPTGFSPTAIKFTFDKPFELFGRSHVMRALKSYELRFHEGPDKKSKGG